MRKLLAWLMVCISQANATFPKAFVSCGLTLGQKSYGIVPLFIKEENNLGLDSVVKYLEENLTKRLNSDGIVLNSEDKEFTMRFIKEGVTYLFGTAPGGQEKRDGGYFVKKKNEEKTRAFSVLRCKQNDSDINLSVDACF